MAEVRIGLTALASAQVWCPPGAQWLFNFHSKQASGVRRAWYSGDTLVGGLQCQRIEQTIIAYEPAIPNGTAFTVQDAPIITNGQGDLIRIWDQANNAFDTLAWFGAVPGDHWNVPQYEFSGACYFEVLDTGSRVIAGIPLRYLIVEEPIVMGIVDTLYERIGFERFYIRPTETMNIDFVTYGLVCYRDNVIDEFDGWLPLGHPCDFTLSLEEKNVEHVQLFPNPGTDHFTVQLPPIPNTIIVSDALGRNVLMQRSNGGSTLINTSGLRSGTYVVRITNATSTPLNMKWIKP
jgi:Secretion system C-terminal sorting domain